MLKKVKNQISGIMISVMILGAALPGQQAFATTNTKDSTKTSASNKIQSQKLTSFESYVNVVDNKYVLKIPSSIKKSINKDDLQLAKDRVITLNNLIDEYKIKDVSMESGFTIIIDESKIASTSVNTSTSNLDKTIMSYSATSKEGVTKVEVHWNYARVWLSKSACRTIGIAFGGGVTAVLGAALQAIPVAGSVAAAAIGAVVIDYFSNKPYSAIWFDWNYVTGHNQKVNFQ